MSRLLTQFGTMKIVKLEMERQGGEIYYNVFKSKCLKGISQQDRAEQDPINVNGVARHNPFNS